MTNKQKFHEILKGIQNDLPRQYYNSAYEIQVFSGTNYSRGLEFFYQILS